MSIAKDILFACLRSEIPAVKRYSDEMMESSLSKKDINFIAERFLCLVQTNLELLYIDCPEIKTKNAWLHSGNVSIQYIKRKLREMEIPVSVKTVCDNVYLLESKVEEEFPSAAYGSKLSFK